MMFWKRMLARTPPAPCASRAATEGSGLVGRDARVDMFIETYVEWREECAALHTAYGRWLASKRSQREMAFATYRAALDREEKAAYATS